MPVQITVPRLGWSMDEGVFVGWLKQEGESVKPGDPLFTIEGDKASQDVESTDGGILRIPPDAPKAGDTVSVGTLLGYLVGKNETWAPAPNQPPSAHTAPHLEEAPQKQDPPTGAVVSTRADLETGRVPAKVAISPRALRRAAELGIDYRQLKGSGRTGRIIEADVVKFAKGKPGGELSTMRRTIALRTAESFSRVPHFYLRTEVDATALVEFREDLLPEMQTTAGVRLTLTDLLLRAQGIALRDCPCANTVWQNDELVQLPSCDVGLVVGLEEGLLMPVIRGADASSLVELVQQRAKLVAAARAGKLTAEQMRGGASSLSNLGNTCADEFAAVIAPAQTSMLAVGRAAPRPLVVNGQVAVRTTLRFCLSVDHRVMDGAPAAKFLGRIVELVVHPSELNRT